ncbi:hypothetical protein [Metabacillus sp. Hm71]|uniref:hypothetical protein n=1 Tax=Metabacillus sp. Hm71 TaxID=3450743 RepID=UPI003F43CC8A
MIKKNGIIVTEGQVWSIGKTTRKMVKEINDLGYEIGEQVEILNDFMCNLIKVRDLETGIRFDVTSKNLGRLIRQREC